MKIRTACVALLASLTLAAGPAGAQNYDGNGLVRFGIFGQGTFVGTDVLAGNTPFLGVETVTTGGGTISGLGIGASIGYDQRMHGNWMWGLEADWVYVGSSAWHAGVRHTVDWTASMRGRLGRYVHPGWLLYGTTGIAFLGIESDAPNDRDTATTRVGWTIGVGTEVDWHHVTLFGEYQFADFGSWSYTGAQGLDTNRYTVDADHHLLRFGIKFKVGHHYHDDVRYPHGRRY